MTVIISLKKRLLSPFGNEYYLKKMIKKASLLAELEEEQESSQGQERGHFWWFILEGLSLNEDDYR